VETPGLLQVQLSTGDTDGLQAVIQHNGNNVFNYGLSSQNITTLLQAIIPAETFTVGFNAIQREVVAGSGSLTVKTMAIWWQTT